AGSADIAISIGAGATVIVAVSEEMRLGSQRFESFAWSSAVVVPHIVGVPAISPEKGSRFSPAGRSPDATLHETLPSVPLTPGARRNGSPTLTIGMAGIVTMKGGGSTVTCRT